MKTIIRTAKLDDLDEIYKIENIIYPEHHWSKDDYAKELTNQLAHYRCAVNSENKIIGHCGFWQLFEEAHLVTIEVLPEYRKQKTATALMIDLTDECYKLMIKYITLEVRESNEPAIKLYEKFLFDSIGMRKKYYQDNGENAIIMFTQNIWYDKFKNNFEKLKDGITKIKVSYD